MKTLLIIYIIMINLIGFFIMGIDKRKARRGKWRVAERTLFTIALLFGSIGILTGMYVFRHKTKHLTFSIGIPAIMVIQLFLIGLLFSWNTKRMGRPAQAVQNELDLIQKLDPDTIQSFVSYENLMNSHLASGVINQETADAVDLFFHNFTYNIHQEEIDGDTATVSVNITNIDMRALARDLCRKILKESVAIYPESRSSTTSDYYRLLRDTLAQNTYELVVTPAYFHLRKDDSGWIILADQVLEDELVSGFISYINDPDILPVPEIVSIHLDALKHLTPAQWKEYLSVEDIFATYNTDFYQRIDDEYIKQLAASFDYEVIKCTEYGSAAEVVIRIKSVDMKNVLTIYKKHLLEYAGSTKSIRDDAVTFSNETSRLLLESLKENAKISSTDIDMIFHNDGRIWEIHFGDEFTNALLGDMRGAIETFNSLSRETLSTETVNN